MAVGLMSRVGPRAASAYISVSGDFSPFDRQIKNEAGKSKARFAAIGKAAAAGIAVGIAVGGKAAVTAAVDLGEQINKTKVVFRGHEKTVLNWSKTTATAIGTSRREALEAAGTFGNMLVPMGFARKEAAKWSVNLVKLAADMASFNNASPADTLDAVRAGLAGETEPLRRYGVFLNDVRLKQEALNLGLKNSVGPNGALTASAKAQATYSLILKDTADTQGDFGRTSGSLANQQRILKAQVEDVGASVGKELIPVLTDAAKFTSKFIHQMQTGKGAGGEFAAVVQDLAGGAKDAAEFVGPVLLDIGKFAAKHDSVVKVAGGVTALALGLKGIKGVGKITGITDLLGGGKGALGRGGGGLISKATPVPVFVTNQGFGPPTKDKGPKVPPVVTTGLKTAAVTAASAARVAVPLIGAGGVLAWVAWRTAGNDFKSGPGAREPTRRAAEGRPGGDRAPGALPGADFLRNPARGAAQERAQHQESQAMRALRIRSIGHEVEALKDRVIAGRRLVERLKTEGASTQEVSRAEKTARARTMELKQAQLALAEASGASRQKIERLRGEIEKLRSKRISVAVDINIPSLNVRAPGNLTGTGPQGPGMHTGDSGPGGDGWGIAGGINRKVAAKVRASAKRDPMAFLIAAGGGPVGGGPGAFHAFDPIAGRFGLSLSSGYRPGSITSSGNLSYHAMNRAGDYSDGAASMLNFARFMAAAFGSKLKELIHTPLGFSIKNGARVSPYAQADHYDHVHVALRRGGIVPGTGDGDKVLLAGEPGEGMINKRAVRALGGPSAIDAINRAIPRFQGGGMVKPEYRRLLRIAAKRHGIPARFLAALIDVESDWDPNAVSPAGAFGLTQFMPGTATGYGVMRGAGHGAVASQIMGAARYLIDLGFGRDKRRALASYNAGPGNWGAGVGYAGDVLGTVSSYAGIGAGRGGGGRSTPFRWTAPTSPFTRRGGFGGMRPNAWKRGAAQRLPKLPRPRPSFTGAEAREGFMGAFSDQLAMRDALAALTPDTGDDLTVAQDAARGWQAFLDVALKSGDQAAITTAATNLKQWQDTITSLTGATEEANRLAEERLEIDRQIVQVEQTKVALLETQGPALLAGLAMFTSDLTGRSAGRGRSFPSFAGVGGLARA